jgi:hypothetical protein
MALQEITSRQAEKTFAYGLATADDVKAAVESKVKAAIDQYMATPKPEVAEPYLWWDLYALGPIQIFQPDAPLAPHQVIKVGQTAFIVTVLLLNPAPILPPNPQGMSPLAVLSNFGLPYEIRYQTGNLTTWQPMPAPLTGTATGSLVPMVPWYVDVLQFVAATPGLMEMNISAQILGNAAAPTAPHFAGFARHIYDFDPELFWTAPAPGWHFEMPVKFLVYP